MIEIKLNHEDDFLKIKETLTRIGIANRDKKKLSQSCHILHKGGLYYITHFKEMMSLDGNVSDISEDDIKRTRAITKLLVEWKLCTTDEDVNIKDNVILHIIPFKEKGDWELIPKYNIGRK